MEFPFVYVRDWSVKIDGIPEASFGSPVNFGDQKGDIFANWEWDADKRELRAEVDPYGLFSLFYSETTDGVMLSTSPIQLIAQGARPGLDTKALAVFHIAGWFIEQDTPFRHIKVKQQENLEDKCPRFLELVGLRQERRLLANVLKS